jgi:hypothetical protein
VKNPKKALLHVAVLLMFASAVQAQKTEVKCHPLSSSNFIGPNESIVDTGADAQVCSTTTTAEKVAPALEKAPTAQPTATTPDKQPEAGAASVKQHDKPVVFLNGTGNTQSTAGKGSFGTTWSTTSQHDQTLELAKDFAGCPVTITMKQDGADYGVLLNHEGNNHNQMALMNAAGQVILTDGAHGLHQSVKNKTEKFCAAIMED